MTSTNSGASGSASPSAAILLRDGTKVAIRPIRPEDEPLMVEFHGRLSDRTVYMRYFCPMSLDQRTAHERLSHICLTDPGRELVLVADYAEPGTEKHHILGVGRLLKLPIEGEAEVTILVSDDHQSKGLGTQLVMVLLQAAREQKLRRINAEILRDNLAIQRMLKKLGLRVHFRLGSEPGSVQAFVDLQQ